MLWDILGVTAGILGMMFAIPPLGMLLFAWSDWLDRKFNGRR